MDTDLLEQISAQVVISRELNSDLDIDGLLDFAERLLTGAAVYKTQRRNQLLQLIACAIISLEKHDASSHAIGNKRRHIETE